MRKFFLFSLLFCYLTFVKANFPGYLGISIRDFTSKNILGAQVINVFDDGAAKQSGILENDIITSINNVSVSKREDLLKQLAMYNWSDKVQVNFIRNGKQKSTEIYLGYKKFTRTYNVKKEIKDGGENWVFEDDHTTILLNKRNEPISISKYDKNGIIDIWKVDSAYKKVEVPQCFLDLEDKMYCIKRIKEEQLKRKSVLDNIVFIKTLTTTKDSANLGKIDFSTEAFSISPNPSNGNFSVNVQTTSLGSSQILIFDITGKIIKSENIEIVNGIIRKDFNLENEAKGVYLLQVKCGEEKYTKKIILK